MDKGMHLPPPAYDRRRHAPTHVQHPYNTTHTQHGVRGGVRICYVAPRQQPPRPATACPQAGREQPMQGPLVAPPESGERAGQRAACISRARHAASGPGRVALTEPGAMGAVAAVGAAITQKARYWAASWQREGVRTQTCRPRPALFRSGGRDGPGTGAPLGPTTLRITDAT
ncbi:hypothetical protein CDD83_8222 [Cordyceps sp. RAO-2017]|nr:hypothetical protein CDD83_8222 [Cordyceps sp. RAO-2017]